MRVELLVLTEILEDGRACRDAGIGDGCPHNDAGLCLLFYRPDGNDADPTRDHWSPIRLDEREDGTGSLRCRECLAAEEAATKRRVLLECESALGTMLKKERDDAERDLAEVMALTPEQVDAELRAAGLDPVQVGERGQLLATTLLAERKRRALARTSAMDWRCANCGARGARSPSDDPCWICPGCGAVLMRGARTTDDARTRIVDGPAKFVGTDYGKDGGTCKVSGHRNPDGSFVVDCIEHKEKAK